jgi:hypothetical protein
MNRSLSALVLVLVLVAAAGSCVTTPAPPPPDIDAERARALLADDAGRRERFEGVVKAALPGIEGAVVNATLDVAAQAPATLSVAVRSFFEVPQQILVASDGTVTLYDATSGSARFARGPATDQSLKNVLGLPLAPDDAVALLLGRAPLEPSRPGWPAPRVRVLGVDVDTFTVAIERVGRGAIHWQVRHGDGVVVAASFFTGDGRRVLDATITDRSPGEDGLAFPRRIVVTLQADSGRRGDVVLTVQDGRFNGPPLPAESFVLEPPPGIPLGAL